MSADKPSTSLDRMFEILDLFSLSNPVLDAGQVLEKLGYTRATGYRYLKALCDAGLLTLTGSGIYAIGPRILELERLHNLTDPLLLAGHEVMAELARADAQSSFLLCNLYRDKVLCVHQAGALRFSAEGRIIPLRRVKGLPLPLFTGAASLAILAFLPQHRIKSLYVGRHQEIAAAGLGETWKAFRAEISAIRKRGYARTVGRMSPDLVAIAATIRTSDGDVIGSLTRIMLRQGFTEVVEAEGATALLAAVGRIEQQLAHAVGRGDVVEPAPAFASLGARLRTT